MEHDVFFSYAIECAVVNSVTLKGGQSFGIDKDVRSGQRLVMMPSCSIKRSRVDPAKSEAGVPIRFARGPIFKATFLLYEYLSL